MGERELIGQAWEYLVTGESPVPTQVFAADEAPDAWRGACIRFRIWAQGRGYTEVKRDTTLTGFYCINPETRAAVELWPYGHVPDTAR